jgi:16S rRNA (guanine(966)-N(2))-methyltransferase RsmD
MRVISGTARGRKLRELPGLATRPTTDQVKEAMFNIIQFDIEGRRVLDLFAGTGQLGIEALSRGADRAVFVDMAGAAAAVVRQNLETAGFTGRAQVVQKDWRAFLSGCRETFDLIFLDPPYRETALENALETIAGIDILSEHGIIVCESPLEKELPDLAAPYEKGRNYKYGKIKVTLYSKNGVK